MSENKDILVLTDFINNNPLEFYEYLLLSPLFLVYSAIEVSEQTNWQKYSNLLIDKFAIHSMSFFHLSKGIVEHKASKENVKMYGYDLFTVNSVFRTIMETYATYNHIYVEPKSEEEIKFRYLLWKIDGLFDKQKYEINHTDFSEAKECLDRDNRILKNTIDEFEGSSFYIKIVPKEIKKIYNLDEKKFNWRFLYVDGKIKRLTITALIEHTCKIRAFINNYRYTSTHIHSNYLAIEHFENFRGKTIPEDYTNPLQKLAIYITSMIISDICSVNKNAKRVFKSLPTPVQEFITGISNSIKFDKH